MPYCFSNFLTFPPCPPLLCCCCESGFKTVSRIDFSEICRSNRRCKPWRVSVHIVICLLGIVSEVSWLNPVEDIRAFFFGLECKSLASLTLLNPVETLPFKPQRFRLEESSTEQDHFSHGIRPSTFHKQHLRADFVGL